MSRRTASLRFGAALFVGAAASGSAATIDFDDLTGGTQVANQYQSAGALLTGNLRVIGPAAGTNPVSAPNSVAFFDPINSTRDYKIRVDFVVPGTSTPGRTDLVGFTPTDAASAGTLFELRAYAVNGVLLGSASATVSASGVYDPLEDTEVAVSAPGIAYAELSVSAPGSAMRTIEGDDLRFTDPVPGPCPAAPAPGCIAAPRGKLKIDERKPGLESLKLSLPKLGTPVPAGGFGDPIAGSSRYSICLYDDSNVLSGELLVDRAGQSCGAEPCWTEKGTGGRIRRVYADDLASAYGVWKITTSQSATGKGKLSVAARNRLSEGQTALPALAERLAGQLAVTAQVLVSDGACFDLFASKVRAAELDLLKASAP